MAEFDDSDEANDEADDKTESTPPPPTLKRVAKSHLSPPRGATW